jgi:hypothetical protein
MSGNSSPPVPPSGAHGLFFSHLAEMLREGVPKGGIRGLQARPFTGIHLDGIGFSNGDLHTPIIPWAGIARWGFCPGNNLAFHPDLIRLHPSPPDDMILVDNFGFHGQDDPSWPSCLSFCNLFAQVQKF